MYRERHTHNNIKVDTKKQINKQMNHNLPLTVLSFLFFPLPLFPLREREKGQLTKN